MNCCICNTEVSAEEMQANLTFEGNIIYITCAEHKGKAPNGLGTD